jgi:hypothetical protein
MSHMASSTWSCIPSHHLTISCPHGRCYTCPVWWTIYKLCSLEMTSCAEWHRCPHTICFCVGHQCMHPEPLKTSVRMAVVIHACLFIYYFTF